MSVLQTSHCAPLDCLFVLSLGCLQTSLVLNQALWTRGVGAADQSPYLPLRTLNEVLQTKPGPWDQGCLR